MRMCSAGCRKPAMSHGYCQKCRKEYDSSRYTAYLPVQMGHAKVWKKQNPLYNTWAQIKQRCYNPDCKDYKRYGAKGVKVFSEWIKTSKPFIKYIEENLGPRPSDHTLDRIDNSGDYAPGNLRWATQKEQIRNSKYGGHGH